MPSTGKSPEGAQAMRQRVTAADGRPSGSSPALRQRFSIKAVVPHEATLELYQVSAVTEGTDAQATVSVRLGTGIRSNEAVTCLEPSRATVHSPRVGASNV